MTPAADLLIPARNEALNVDALADVVLPLRDAGVVRRIVLVDNGSTDGTGERAAARGLEVVREAARGYGAACLTGLRTLGLHDGHDDGRDLIAFLDADLADDPAGLPALLRPLLDGRADLVIGSRRKLHVKGSLTPVQVFGNALACALMRLATGRRHTDLGPFRAATRDALRRLEMADTTWGWTVEMQFKAATRGLRTVELDVPYRKRHAGRSQISGTIIGSCRAGRKILTTIATLWWTERRRR